MNANIMKSISIVAPCFNEGKNLWPFVNRLAVILEEHPTYRFELIFINDGSSDDTEDILKKITSTHSWIKGIGFTRNFGKEAALTAGLDQANGDAVIFIDADLQHPPELIHQFITLWEKGALVVAGRRISRDTDGKLYSFFARAFYHIHNIISDIKLPANVGDFRLIDRQVADQLKTLPERCRFMKGIFAWAGYEPHVVDYEVQERSSGISTFSKWRYWNLALEGITSFSTVPLRAWTYIGSLVLLLGLCYSMYIVIAACIHGIDTPGYVTLLTAVVIFGGIQLIGIGILGEYIGRIYLEIKQRPHYLIKEMIDGQHQS